MNFFYYSISFSALFTQMIHYCIFIDAVAAAATVFIPYRPLYTYKYECNERYNNAYDGIDKYLDQIAEYLTDHFERGYNQYKCTITVNIKHFSINL